MKKRLIITLTFLLFAAFSFCRAEEPTPYQYWPDTDPEWNKLTNHITWCRENLRKRWYVVKGITNNVFNEVHVDRNNPLLNDRAWEPSYIWPYRDYMLILSELELLAPYFVNQTLAEESDFSDYFNTANIETGLHPGSFPLWTPESLCSNVTAKSSWSTNTVLTAWMAVTNRAFVAEITEAINLLQWSVYQGPNTIVSSEQGTYKGASIYTNVAPALALDDLNRKFAQSESSSSMIYDVYAKNDDDNNGDGYGKLDSWINYGTGVKFDMNAYRNGIFTFNSVNHLVPWPTVLSYVGMEIKYSGYTPASSLINQQRVFYCASFSGVQTPVTNNINPLIIDAPVNQLPLSYAGLDSIWHEQAKYTETGYSLWLMKWGFDEFPMELIPNEKPIETPDTDRDDLFEVPVANILGSETGTFVVTHEDENLFLYIPLVEPNFACKDLPLHVYLSQGTVTNLPYHFISGLYGIDNQTFYRKNYNTCGVENYSTFISAETRIQEIQVISNETQHIKQVLVIRPRGQAVIFDFPWDDNAFSQKGYPVGVNKNLGYILHDLDPESS